MSNILNTNYNVSNDESQRINILKLWLSIMVVFVHSYTLVNETNAIITPTWLQTIKHLFSWSLTRCAVPAFFIISSIFLYRKSFDYFENLKKKTQSILIPYLLLNTFWIVFFLFVQSIPGIKEFFSEKNSVYSWNIFDYLNAYLGFRTGFPILRPLWFMKDLFFMNMIAPIIKKTVDRFPKAFFIFLSIIWLFNIGTRDILFCMDIQALCFFTLGYYIVKYKISLNSFVNKLKPIILIISYIVFVSLDTYFNIYTNNIFFQTLIPQINTIIAILFWYKFTTHFKNSKTKNILLWLSSYNLSIFLFHEMNNTMIKQLCAKIFPQTALVQLLEYFLIPTFIILCCILGSIILQKYTPKIYAILTGNRKKVPNI